MTRHLLVSVAVTLLVSAGAGLLAARLRLPGGSIVWAIAAAAALHMSAQDLDPLPGALRTLAQVLIGITIGAGLSRGPLRALNAVRRQVALSMVLLLAGCTAAGLALAALTPLDRPTSLLSVGPGGASDMAVAAVYFQVDAALVAGLQVVRQLLVFGVVPVLFAFVRSDPPGPAPSPEPPER